MSGLPTGTRYLKNEVMRSPNCTGIAENITFDLHLSVADTPDCATDQNETSMNEEETVRLIAATAKVKLITTAVRMTIHIIRQSGI